MKIDKPGSGDASRESQASIIDLIRLIPLVAYILLGVPVLLIVVIGAARAASTWTGLAGRNHPDDIFAEFISTSMLAFIWVYCWRSRWKLSVESGSLGETASGLRVEVAALLLVAAEVKALMTTMILGFIVIVLLAIADAAFGISSW